MKLSKSEAINLILEFFMLTNGVWKDVEYDNPILERFIKAGLTCLDLEDKRKIVPTEKGKDILFS